MSDNSAAEKAQKHVIFYYDKCDPQSNKVLILIKLLNYEAVVMCVSHCHAQCVTHTAPVLRSHDCSLSDGHAALMYLCETSSEKCAKQLFPSEISCRYQIINKLFFEKSLFNKTDGMCNCRCNSLAIYDVLESKLSDKPYLLGDKITLADISFVAEVTALNVCLLIEYCRWPNLFCWLQRMLALPAVNSVVGRTCRPCPGSALWSCQAQNYCANIGENREGAVSFPSGSAPTMAQGARTSLQRQSRKEAAKGNYCFVAACTCQNQRCFNAGMGQFSCIMDSLIGNDCDERLCSDEKAKTLCSCGDLQRNGEERNSPANMVGQEEYQGVTPKLVSMSTPETPPETDLNTPQGDVFESFKWQADLPRNSGEGNSPANMLSQEEYQGVTPKLVSMSTSETPPETDSNTPQEDVFESFEWQADLPCNCGKKNCPGNIPTDPMQDNKYIHADLPRNCVKKNCPANVPTDPMQDNKYIHADLPRNCGKKNCPANVQTDPMQDNKYIQADLSRNSGEGNSPANMLSQEEYQSDTPKLETISGHETVSNAPQEDVFDYHAQSHEIVDGMAPDELARRRSLSTAATISSAQGQDTRKTRSLSISAKTSNPQPQENPAGISNAQAQDIKRSSNRVSRASNSHPQANPVRISKNKPELPTKPQRRYTKDEY